MSDRGTASPARAGFSMPNCPCGLFREPGASDNRNKFWLNSHPAPVAEAGNVVNPLLPEGETAIGLECPVLYKITFI